MAVFTDEEREELAGLEREEKDRLEAESVAAKRQHLEALRMVKRLSAKHGVPGKDFIVLETKVGNIAVRKPKDVEVDTIEESSPRDVLETFAATIAIEPPTVEVQKLMAEHPALTNAIVIRSLAMLKVMQEENAKK